MTRRLSRGRAIDLLAKEREEPPGGVVVCRSIPKERQDTRGRVKMKNKTKYASESLVLITRRRL